MNIILSGNTGPTLTHQWYDGLNNLLGTAQTQTVTSADTYTLIVTDTYNGKSNSDTFIITNITATPNIVITASDTSFTTVGQLISLDGSESYGIGTISYSWTTSDGTIESDELLPIIYVSSEGTYTLVCTDSANNCTSTTDISISGATPDPIAVISGGTELTCSTTSIILDGTYSQGIGELSYSWSNGATTSAITITTTGTYTLTITEVGSGKVSNIANHTVTSNLTTVSPTITLTGTTELSVSQPTIRLNGPIVSGVTYYWSGGNIISSNTASSVIIDAPGTYGLTITNSNGCTSNGTKVITESVVAPIARINGYSTLTCTRTSITLDGSTSSGVNKVYVWSTGASTPTIIINTSGTYSLRINDDNGTNIVYKTIGTNTTVPSVIITNSANSTELSTINPTITLSVPSVTTYSYLWSNGATTSSIVVATAGSYSVTVTNTANGCSDTSLVVGITQSNTAPTALIVTNTTTLTCTGTSITLNGSTSYSTPIGHTLSYKWYRGNYTTLVGSNTTYSVTIPGYYILRVTDSYNGLTSDAFQSIGENKYILTTAIAAPNGLALTTPTPTTTLALNGTVTSAGGVGTLNAVKYLWVLTGGAATNSSLTGASILAKSGGTYTLTVTDLVTGCYDSESVLVTPYAAPGILNVSISGSTHFLTCTTTTVPIKAVITNGTPPYTYLWNTAATTSTINVTASGIYDLTVTDSHVPAWTGNASYSFASNTTNPTAVITSPNLVISTSNPSVTLSGSSNASNPHYEWWASPQGLLMVGNPYITNIPRTYTLIVTDLDNGCMGAVSSGVTESVVYPTVYISGDSVITCDNTVTTVTVLEECLASMEFIVQYSTTTGPCIGGHTCNAAAFYLKGDAVNIGLVSLNNYGGTYSATITPGIDSKNYPPGVTSGYDRYNVLSLTNQQVIDMAAASDNSGGITFSLVCATPAGVSYSSYAAGTCHNSVTWITLKRNGTTIYSGCPIGDFIRINPCTGETDPPWPITPWL